MTKRICSAALVVVLALLSMGEASISAAAKKPAHRTIAASKRHVPVRARVRKPSAAQRILASVVQMLASLKAISKSAFDQIESLYKPKQDQMAFLDREALSTAIKNSVLVPLPEHPERFNIRPRLVGRARIAEKDPDHVELYMASRPYVIGCMMELGDRVKSGPIDLTGLTRSVQYQGWLAGTNKNAVTRFPAHTLAIAFDIGLLNTPANTALEIRRVLDQMAQEGKILYIAEVNQVSFHVVPLPDTEQYFTKVYSDNLALAAQP